MKTKRVAATLFLALAGGAGAASADAPARADVAGAAGDGLDPALVRGLAGALEGCREWVLDPQSWTDGSSSLPVRVGLAGMMGEVPAVDAAALPPEAWRQANHYWRINATLTSGYILVVSDQLPICHLTGGGDADLQPVIEAVLASEAFRGAWREGARTRKGDIVSTRYTSIAEPAFEMLVSRADRPGRRRDRVQVVASASLSLSGG